ncbi:glycoside hydrolase family 97 catalytic domain-containing protein [uncultured Paludibaculum sp.]|uniref:glycoside hydrolase family 97 protein n=1 Tax=uncultured Paludibaculum sp. TaxID=1765020 RepID=UPI002AAB4611|nr:glycoside hydrolase family 97 N-terminal domain-containing protein [uncultured Paludibaculum sp.]
MGLARLFVAVCLVSLCRAQSFEMKSPDGRLVFRLEANQYRVDYAGQSLILPSTIGLVLDGAAPLGPFLRVGTATHTTHSSEWRPVYGERAVIPDRYEEAVVELQEAIPPRRSLQLIVRAYDEGIAFRYRLPAAWAIQDESTQFALPPGTLAWETHGAQGRYAKIPVDDLQPNVERPLTLEYVNGVYAAIAEASLDNYPSMRLSHPGKKRGVVAVSLAGTALTSESPWRVILVGRKPGELLEHNYLLLNLCPPSRIADTSWIRPGKVLREVTLSTKGAREAVDFAVRRGLSYIEFDAGWYGHEYSDDSDASRVRVDPLRLRKEPDYQGLDLPAVIAYARNRKIGVLLYVNRRAMERQLDEILPLYEKWGVSGVKYGFVNTGSQAWTRWLYSAVAKAAAHHLMVDIHDEFRPTGLSRTWPNLLTQEGIRGNEEFPDATHNTIMPFTRYLAGAADYTICWSTPRLKNTAAHQMALSVVYYSPFQFMYWYDRPSDVDESNPALTLFDHVATVWDETRVLDGRPGESVVVARRSGRRWFVGGITNNEPRTVTVPLSFLNSPTPVTATVYTDGASARDVKVEQRQVTSSDKLVLSLAPSGGFAVELQ